MNIQETIKMNNLIADIKGSSHLTMVGDAVSMATDIYEEATPEIQENHNDTQEIAEASQTTTEKGVDKQDVISLIDCNNVVINEAFNKLNDQLEQLKTEIKELKQNTESIHQKPESSEPAISPDKASHEPVVEQAPDSNQEVQEPEKKPKNEKQEVLETEEKDSNQRVGDFSPENIELEEFFYFGKK